MSNMMRNEVIPVWNDDKPCLFRLTNLFEREDLCNPVSLTARKDGHLRVLQCISTKKPNKMKLLINVCYGGFGISNEAIELWAKKKNIALTKRTTEYGDYDYYTDGDEIISGCFIDRDDPALIEVFEELGSARTSGDHSDLTLVELPDNCKYDLTEYDGWESISNTWITVSVKELIEGLSPDRVADALNVMSIKVARNKS